MKVRVANSRQETADITSYELVAENETILPAFTAGAHIDVLLENGITRQYSLCNSSADRSRYVIAVLRDPNSRGGSQFIHQSLRCGDTLVIGQPRNLFPLDYSAEHTVLFAGGIGVTPILSMAEELHRLGKSFEMHYSTRSKESTAFYEYIKKTEFQHKVIFHFDDQPHTHLDFPSALQVGQQGRHIYVCGPSGFIQYVLDIAAANCWSDKNLHREYFNAAITSTGANEVFAIRIASTGAVFEVEAHESIVDVLQRNEVFVPVSCSEGVCGTCITRVLEGMPDHRDVFLTCSEREANDQFTPCCSRSKSPLLVLDL